MPNRSRNRINSSIMDSTDLWRTPKPLKFLTLQKAHLPRQPRFDIIVVNLVSLFFKQKNAPIAPLAANLSNVIRSCAGIISKSFSEGILLKEKYNLSGFELKYTCAKSLNGISLLTILINCLKANSASYTKKKSTFEKSSNNCLDIVLLVMQFVICTPPNAIGNVVSRSLM